MLKAPGTGHGRLVTVTVFASGQQYCHPGLMLERADGQVPLSAIGVHDGEDQPSESSNFWPASEPALEQVVFDVQAGDGQLVKSW
jgi:hypothetical protein